LGGSVAAFRATARAYWPASGLGMAQGWKGNLGKRGRSHPTGTPTEAPAVRSGSGGLGPARKANSVAVPVEAASLLRPRHSHPCWQPPRFPV